MLKRNKKEDKAEKRQKRRLIKTKNFIRKSENGKIVKNKEKNKENQKKRQKERWEKTDRTQRNFIKKK